MFLLILPNFSKSETTCPINLWSECKIIIDEGAWSFIIPDSREVTAIFAVDGKTLY